MKKIITMICLLALITGVNAQSKTVQAKVPAQSETVQAKVNPQSESVQAEVTAPPVDSLELLKTNAEKWFKEVYVEKKFKDPYSYRLVGLKAIPVTYANFLHSELEIVKNEIDTFSLSDTDRSIESLEKLKLDIIKGKTEINDLAVKIKTLTKANDIDFENKRVAIYKHFYMLRLSLAERIEIYQLAVKSKVEIERIINNLQPEQANKIKHYDIRLDCYSKNSIGNEVLSRFSFPVTKELVAEENNGIDKVKQLN